MIEGVEQLLANGGKLWEMLVSLLYYQKGKVQVVLSGEAGVVDAQDWSLKKLMRGNVVWMGAMSVEEVGEVIREHAVSLEYPVMRYEAGIRRIANGHYGTVKYLCQMIAENKYDGEKLAESRVIGWARERGDVEYFLEQVWGGYSVRQRGVIRRWIENRGKLGGWQSGVVDEIVRSGLWYRGGRDVRWRVRWVESFVREYVLALPDERRVLGEEELELFGKKERMILDKLVSSKGKIVGYNEIADAVMGVGRVYSRWAVARLVGRVRAKLMEVGPWMHIETVRGEGYRLVS